MGALNGLYEKYRDRVEFLLVYIREAHPIGPRQIPQNEIQGILLHDPKTLGERRQVCSDCVKTLGIKFPALVDTLEDVAERSYAGWPDRMYVIDADGKIAYKGDTGPQGFRVGDVTAFLEKLFAEER